MSGVYFDRNRSRWVLSFRDHRGRRVRKTMPDDKQLNTRREAEARLARIRVEIGEGRYVSPRDVPTVAVAARHMLDAHPQRNERLERRLATWVLPWFGDRKVNQITLTDVRTWVRAMREGVPRWMAEEQCRARLALGTAGAHRHDIDPDARTGMRATPGMINAAVKVLSAIFKDAQANRWRIDDPTVHIERERKPRREERPLLNPEEASRLIAEARGVFQLAIEMALKTGARKGELLALRWSDLDLREGTMSIRRTVRKGRFTDPKTAGSRRTIELPSDLVRRLREYRVASPYSKDSDLVLCSPRGTPLGHGTLDHVGLRPALRRAGLPAMRWHDMRHSAASILISMGWDCAEVSQRLGHSSPAITLKVYVRAFRARAGRRDDLDAMSRAISGTKVSRQP